MVWPLGIGTIQWRVMWINKEKTNLPIEKHKIFKVKVQLDFILFRNSMKDKVFFIIHGGHINCAHTLTYTHTHINTNWSLLLIPSFFFHSKRYGNCDTLLCISIIRNCYWSKSIYNVICALSHKHFRVCAYFFLLLPCTQGVLHLLSEWLKEIKKRSNKW